MCNGHALPQNQFHSLVQRKAVAALAELSAEVCRAERDVNADQVIGQRTVELLERATTAVRVLQTLESTRRFLQRERGLVLEPAAQNGCVQGASHG